MNSSTPKSAPNTPTETSSGADPRIRALERKVARLSRATAAFRHVAAALTKPVDLDRVLQTILEHSPSVVDAERATLYLYDPDREVLLSKFSAGGRIDTIEIQLGQGIAGTVAKEQRPIRVEDAYDDARFSPQWDKLTGFRTRAVLAVPMKNHQGHLIGVLQALNKRGGGAFSREDELLFSSFATQAAISIENTRLVLTVTETNRELAAARLSLEKKIKELRFLHDLESAMAWASSEKQLASSLLALILDATHARLAVLLIVPREGEKWLLYAMDSKHKRKLTTATVRPTREGLLAKALRKGNALRRARLTRREGELGELQQAGLDARRGMAAPLFGEHEEPLGVLAVFDRLDDLAFVQEDVAFLRLVAANVATALVLLRARESQRVSDRMSTIGRLLSGVVHDLKTPMAVIAGYAQMLVETDSREERRQLANVILEQVSHVTDMQRELLAFARGEKSLLIRKVYLEKFFADVRAQIEREIEGHPVELQMELRDRGVAWFDATKMTRAIHNLTQNAIEAMGEEGGVLTITVDRKEDTIVIEVRDTGPGISPEIESRLFQSFVSEGKERGTGLGLAIVKKIVERHGGKIELAPSERGARFVITLPVGNGPPALSQQDSEKSTSMPSKRSED